MAKHERLLPSLFNNCVTKKDPVLFDQEPDIPFIKSEYTCLTNANLCNLVSGDLYDGVSIDNELFGNPCLVFGDVMEEPTSDLIIYPTANVEGNEVDTDSGRGSFSEMEDESNGEEGSEVEADDETDDESKEETMQDTFLDYVERFVEDQDIDERARKRAIKDLSSVDASFVMDCHPADLWKLNCEVGIEFKNYLSKTWPTMARYVKKSSSSPARVLPAKRQSCRRRKVYIHTFCLDLLLHPQTFGSIVEWIDTKALTFRVLNTHQVAHLWCLVKGNSLEDYETFGRGVRFSMARGFFTRMRPQKKKTYRLTEKALRNYNSYRPGIVPHFNR